MDDAHKVKIGAVSYLNTKPMIHGLADWSEATLTFDYPSRIAAMLVDGTIDIGLVPVAVLPLLPSHHIVSNFGIAATGAVQTVCVYSEVPMNEVERIYLDYQSKTSVQLLKILLQHHWQLNPQLMNATEGYETKITGTTAGLVIGNRAFELNKQYPYIYDLSQAWFSFTGLPFVFALWVANKPLPTSFTVVFEQKIQDSLQQFLSNIAVHQLNPVEINYITNVIEYKITAAHKAGLNKFFSML